MTARTKAAASKKPVKKIVLDKKLAAKKAVIPVKKSALPAKPALPAAKPAMPARPLPGQLARPMAPASGAAKPPAKPPLKSPSSGVRPPGSQGEAAARQALAQQAEERRKAATRKLFARLRSLEAIIGADLRKRGSLLLSQAVDQWYAEAISATATDVSITNAARAVISHI
jgi:hypothetical protein